MRACVRACVCVCECGCGCVWAMNVGDVIFLYVGVGGFVNVWELFWL